MEIFLDFNHASVKEWYHEFKDNLACVQCGDQGSIQFHHTDPWNKKAAVGTLIRRRASYREVADEITKCEPLCPSCHRKEHKRNREWYENRIWLRKRYGRRDTRQELMSI